MAITDVLTAWIGLHPSVLTLDISLSHVSNRFELEKLILSKLYFGVVGDVLEK